VCDVGRLNFPTKEEERNMALGLTAMLTGNEGREKKEKKTTKRAAAAAAAKGGGGGGGGESPTIDAKARSPSSSSASSSAAAAGGEGGYGYGYGSPKRQRRAVVLKAEEKVRHSQPASQPASQAGFHVILAALLPGCGHLADALCINASCCAWWRGWCGWLGARASSQGARG
jgi:hypothetical protein